jgi:hypothetical protein
MENVFQLVKIQIASQALANVELENVCNAKKDTSWTIIVYVYTLVKIVRTIVN